MSRLVDVGSGQSDISCPQRRIPATVFFEPDWRGHAAEWLRHVLDELEQSPYAGRILFIVPRKLLAVADDQLKPITGRGVEPVALTRWEEWACTLPVLSVRAFCQWWVVRRHARAAGATNVFLFEFDLLTLPLALQLGMGSARISGILFRPSVHYPLTRGHFGRWRDWARNLRKDFLYGLTFRNRAVRTVFSLDPYFPDAAKGRYARGGKVKVLPDPIDPRREFTNLAWAQVACAPSDRVTFVLFGSLTRRKGLLVLLEALACIERGFGERIAVRIAGVIDQRLHAEVRDRLADLRARRPEILIEVDDRYFSQAELLGVVDQCDVVLAPYQNFVGSSGILLWAARADKPILTTDYGLLGRFVREYRLGLTVDTTNPSKLAASMVALVREGPRKAGDSDGRAMFLRGRSPARFARMILAATRAGAVNDESYMACGTSAATDH